VLQSLTDCCFNSFLCYDASLCHTTVVLTYLNEQDLYVTFGDGGGPNDQYDNAQNRKTLLGAMLRISVPVKDGDAVYTIPKSNPYQPGNAQGFLPEIYAYG
jgi:glucose/arabinose dehydrogenase